MPMGLLHLGARVSGNKSIDKFCKEVSSLVVVVYQKI
jgi:hypothetical protein